MGRSALLLWLMASWTFGVYGQDTFPAPDYPGEYSVIYRCITEEGEITTVEVSFRVQ
jgi:hypothetical protein